MEERWEAVNGNTGRMEVPGGWLYRVWSPNGTWAVAFVPKPKE